MHMSLREVTCTPARGSRIAHQHICAICSGPTADGLPRTRFTVILPTVITYNNKSITCITDH